MNTAQQSANVMDASTIPLGYSAAISWASLSDQFIEHRPDDSSDTAGGCESALLPSLIRLLALAESES
jgi:hypothetical protein